ncbi:MAG: hypothetical protein JO027_19895 [Solirubrobacterales bacterium]|nr:hypothetical protein [Solirubrobacterales bacterium]
MEGRPGGLVETGARPVFEQRQPGSRASQPAGDAHPIAGPRPVPSDQLVRVVRPADHGERHRESGGAGDVATGDHHADVLGQGVGALHERGRRLGPEAAGQPKHQVGLARSGAHRGQVRHGAGQRAVPDLLRAQLIGAEVDAVNHGIDRGHRVAVSPDHRRVVADRADHAAARAPQQGLERADQLELAQRCR